MSPRLDPPAPVRRLRAADWIHTSLYIGIQAAVAWILLGIARGSSLSMGTFSPDAFVQLDAGWRVVSGGTPNLDWHAPLGPLHAWASAAAILLFGPALPSVAAADWSMAVGASLLVAAAAWRTLGGKRAAALSAAALLLAASPSEMGMPWDCSNWVGTYNRWCWALLIAAACALIPHSGSPSSPLRTPRTRWGWANAALPGAAAGTAMAAAFLIKGSFGIFGLPAAVACFAIGGGDRRRRSAWALAVAAFLLVPLLASPMGRGYAADMARTAALADSPLPYAAEAAAVNAPAIFILLSALALLMRRRGGGSRTAAAAVVWGLAAAPMVLSCGQSPAPLLAAVAFIAILEIGKASEAASGTKTPPKVGSIQGRKSLLAAAAIIILAAQPMQDGAGVVGAWAAPKAVAASPSAVSGMGANAVDPGSAPHSEFTAARESERGEDGEDVEPGFLNGGEYLEEIEDGRNLIAALSAPHESIFAVDFANPFTVALGRPPPRGDLLWHHIHRTFDSTHHPDPNTVADGADLIAVPRFGVDVHVLSRVMAPVIKRRFHRIGRSRFWTLYRRNANP